MTGLDESIIAQAANWHIASESDAMDWDGFTTWLEADQRHRAAYDEIALADALLTDHRAALTATADDEPDNDAGHAHDARATRRPRVPVWTRWAGIAAAASLAALFLVPGYLKPAQTEYATGATSRSIALADGSTILLAPRSRLTVKGSASDHLILEGGAWFDIAHRPGRSLTIDAGAARISDIGTRFDVQNAGGDVRVAVAQGKVQVAANGLSLPIALTAGKRLLFDADAARATIAPVSPDDAGGWRRGRLSYASAPLPLVAGDLARYAGVGIKVPASLADRQFSGTLVIGDGDRAARDLSQVMQLSLVRDGGGYRLVERSR